MSKDLQEQVVISKDL